MKKYFRENIKLFICIIVFLALGIFMLASPLETVYFCIAYVLSFVIILFAADKVIKIMKNRKFWYLDVVEILLDLGIVICLCTFMYDKPETVYLGLIFLIIPLIRLFLINRKIVKEKREFVKYLYGIALVIFSPATFDSKIYFNVIGVILIIVSLICIYLLACYGEAIVELKNNTNVETIEENDDNIIESLDHVVIDVDENEEKTVEEGKNEDN